MIGCAALAATATGRFSGAEAAVGAYVRYVEEAGPDPRWAETYARMQPLFDRLYQHRRRFTTISTLGRRALTIGAKPMKEILSTFRPDLFAGKRVLVSGGTSGIGLALAKGFARLAADVTATGASAGATLIAPAPTPKRKRSGSKRSTFATARRSARSSRVCRLHVLINSAGVAKPEREYEEEEFLDVMDVNLNSVMRLSMAARPLLMRSKGAILNFASMLSYLADDSVPAYGASKTGVLGLTRALAHRFGPAGVRVNAIAPGYHATDMTKALWWEIRPRREDRGEGRAEAMGNGR